MNKLAVARILLALGMLAGLQSWWMTMHHIWDPDYLLISAFEKGATHARYHAFREGIGDAAASAVLMVLFFGPDRFRTRESWLIALLIMIGTYAPFWIGAPFSSDLTAPHFAAEVVHVTMALPSIVALFLAKPAFIRDAWYVQVTRRDHISRGHQWRSTRSQET